MEDVEYFEFEMKKLYNQIYNNNSKKVSENIDNISERTVDEISQGSKKILINIKNVS